MPYSEADQRAAAVIEAKPRARRDSRSWFFVCMASILLVIVAVGFAKSFYLRNIIFIRAMQFRICLSTSSCTALCLPRGFCFSSVRPCWWHPAEFASIARSGLLGRRSQP